MGMRRTLASKERIREGSDGSKSLGDVVEGKASGRRARRRASARNTAQGNVSFGSPFLYSLPIFAPPFILRLPFEHFAVSIFSLSFPSPLSFFLPLLSLLSFLFFSFLSLQLTFLSYIIVKMSVLS